MVTIIVFGQKAVRQTIIVQLSSLITLKKLVIPSKKNGNWKVQLQQQLSFLLYMFV